MISLIRALLVHLVVALTCLLSAIMFATAASAQSLQPAGWDADLRLATIVDRNPDPNVVEVDLESVVADVELSPGESVKAWTYNGSLPGPLIRAKRGDRLIVHFSNRLSSPTTVHWHGLRVPIQMDGVPEHSQPDVAPGESFTYDFVLKDAGLFWYHPHVLSAAQVGFGLYGALLVDDPDDSIGIPDEAVLVLSDIAIDGTTLESPDSGGSIGMVFGREGNRVLVNGRTRASMTARPGVLQRWRVVNAAKSRYFQLDLDGQPFTVVGTDGGLQEFATTSNLVVLAPGERLDLVVAPHPAEDGAELVLRSGLFNRGYGSVEYRSPEDLLVIRFSGSPVSERWQRTSLRSFGATADRAATTNVALELTLAQTDERTFTYGINGKPFGAGVVVRARVGETQVWTLTNSTKWSHPFHLHGFFFEVLDSLGKPVQPRAWKDTIDVPFETTVQILVRFDDRPGMWMYHCHILDHADGGLMGMVEVTPAANPSGHNDHTP